MRRRTHSGKRRPGRAVPGGPRGSRILATVLAALVVVVPLATACGGGTPAGEASAEGRSTDTYRNDSYRFSITYDALLTQGEADEGGDTGADFGISFVDETGPKAGEAYVDGVRVSVFELARAVKTSEVRGLKPQLEAVVADRLAKLPSGEVTEPLARTAVNGTPGFTVSYTFATDGMPVTAVSTFLFSGQYQYEVTGQARAAHWEELRPTLEAAMASFTVD